MSNSHGPATLGILALQACATAANCAGITKPGQGQVSEWRNGKVMSVEGNGFTLAPWPDENVHPVSGRTLDSPTSQAGARVALLRPIALRNASGPALSSAMQTNYMQGACFHCNS